MTPHIRHVFLSAAGDRATVRYKQHGRVYFAYIGPLGEDGVHFADTAGRSDVCAGDFSAIYPVHADDCHACATIMRWRARKNER